MHICCEPFSQYIDVLQNKIRYEHDRHYIIIKSTWETSVTLFPPKSVDTVFLLDIIEHLEKSVALELLKMTEKIDRRQIVVFTPLGFLPQHHPDQKDEWGLNGGVWQEHKSGWYPEDFDNSWNIYASQAFHEYDNLGRKYPIPYGALWAIKNITDNEFESYDKNGFQNPQFLTQNITFTENLIGRGWSWLVFLLKKSLSLRNYNRLRRFYRRFKQN